MYKNLVVVTLVLLLIAGCSSQGKDSSADPQSSPPIQTEGNNVSPSPTSSIAPTESSVPTQSPETVAYLDKEKLKAIFGFSDKEGKYLLVTGQNEGEEKVMASLNRAIGENGSVLAVKFVKWQKGSEQSNGRDTAQNFVNVPGYLFLLEEGSVVPNQTYYLADQAEFNLKSLLSIQPANENNGSAKVGEGVKAEITAAQQREIEQIWKLADISGKGELYLVQFVKQDKDMLFSFVLKEDKRLTFMNYPAVLQDEYSVWRVDDGGKVSPEMFSILFAAETVKGMVLGINWWGAEGVNTFLLEQVGDTFKEMDIEYSRYTSPV
ncbi:MAG: hypothetical protein K6T94_21600 [Paenibacillus sp.]|nr:hypothetical protein [Paenibacillus sp.]